MRGNQRRDIYFLTIYQLIGFHLGPNPQIIIGTYQTRFSTECARVGTSVVCKRRSGIEVPREEEGILVFEVPTEERKNKETHREGIHFRVFWMLKLYRKRQILGSSDAKILVMFKIIRYFSLASTCE